MVKKLITIMLATVFVGCSVLVGVAPLPATEIVTEKINKYDSIAMIFAIVKEDGSRVNGTGFAISKDLIMTAGHVCSAMQQLQAMKMVSDDIFIAYYGNDNETVLVAPGVKVLAIDALNDICILEKKEHGLVPIKMVDNYYIDVAVHETVYIVGAPLGLFASSMEGEVIGKSFDMSHQLRKKMVITSAATGGSSGSPIFNKYGLLVGMLIAGFTQYDHASICTSVPYIKNFMAIYHMTNINLNR